MLKRIFSLIMALVLFITYAFSVSAADITYEEWSEYYKTCDNTKVLLTPGKDETEVSFAWHSEWNVKTPKVRISKNADMSDYKEFTGYATFSENSNQRSNNVTATGLEEHTTYYYSYGVSGEFSEPVVYRTRDFDSFKFLFVSDVQPTVKNDIMKESYIWNQSLEAAFTNNDDISFIVNGGDVTNDGDYNEEWTGVLAPTYLRSYPMASAPGNHDKRGTSFRYYFNHPNVYHGMYPSKFGDGYWFRYGDVLFVVINSIRYELLGKIDSIAGIKEAVEANPDAKWRIAVTHYDFYGPGPHASESAVIEKKEMLVPALEHYDFDLVLTGHDHMYGRSYFMQNDKMVYNEGYDEGTVVDPEGILYITASGSKGNARYDKQYNYPWIAKDYVSKNDCYSTIEITDDGQLKLITVDKITDRVIDTFNIKKTDSQFENKEFLGGVFGSVLQGYTGEYFIIFEMLYDLSTAVKRFFDRFVGA